MKRVALQAAPLTITLERCSGDEVTYDYLDFSIARGDLHVASGEIDRDRLPASHQLSELSGDERAQVNGAILAEWLDWQPTITAADIPTETILDLFEALKRSLVGAGVVKAEGKVA